MKLQRLYKTSSKGATQVIDMEIIGDTYTRTWGQLDGKMQSKSTTAKGKNIGKANETSPEEQAIIEAKAVWVKKQKANYSLSPEAPVTVNLPMKVNDYHKHKNKVNFPCFASPKLNGINCEYRLVDGELILLSRGGEEYPIPEHQRASVLAAMELYCVESINGEMYKHGEHLQDIMAATKKHNDLTEHLVFFMFDLPTLNIPYEEKVSILESFSFPYVIAVDIVEVTSHEGLTEYHNACTAKGLEGIIIRNKNAMYEYNTRSLNVFKYKVAQDAEFKVTDYELDKNGHAVFQAQVGINTFKVKLKGTNEERLAMAAEASSYIGKWLKVEFETWSRDGIPLKPVGIMFRKVDENGEATE